MDVKLIAVSPKGGRKIFPLSADVTTLGRADCSLRIPLEEISRQHCQVILSEDKATVKDLDSSNGTFVNGEQVTERDLQPGDVISLANALNFLVQIDGQPAEIDEDKLRRPKPGTAPPKQKKPPPAKPAAPFAATSTSSTDEDVADQILGESFFLDMEDEEEDEAGPEEEKS